MTMRFAAILLLSVALACPARAESAYDRCIAQSDGTNQAWGACGNAWVSREDARLNAAWKAVLPLLEGDAAKALLAEQRAWVAYKEASCAFYAKGDYGREGQVLHYPMCRAQVIAARTADLKAVEAFVNQGR